MKTSLKNIYIHITKTIFNMGAFVEHESMGIGRENYREKSVQNLEG